MTSPEASARYHARIGRVLDYIDRNLDGDLAVAVLAELAAWSPFHFHRQFAALTGLPVAGYVQRARLRLAADKLAYRDRLGVTEVALDAGYDTPDAFARAFRRRLGQSPSGFRAAPDWAAWHAAFDPLAQARSLSVSDMPEPDVRIMHFPETRVAALTHHGAPAAIGDTIRHFIAWRRAHGLHPECSATFNLFHDDPRTTPPEAFRLTLCAGIEAPVASNPQGVVESVIPGGRCAAVRVTGGGDAIERAALFLYRDWLPGSGEALRDFPLFCRRITMFPDVPEPDAASDLFLPLA